ncbi:MAG TPA: NUDIX hydrolase [Candidatus Pristimantibacillus sp.]|nr:NUDIX hydrolase [Candidatus Pristimantibacillus sp.]
MNTPCFYRVSVKGLVIDETGRFLLAKEDNGQWELPGGGLEHGEDPIDGLRREIHEETGLVITEVSKSPKYFTTSKRRGGEAYVANVIYEVKLKDLDFVPSDECQELRFFTVDEARQEPLFETVERFLGVFDPGLHN